MAICTRNGFTLTELLITFTIIAILAAMSLGALANVREMGREAATKATIAKLNDIIMRRYESYMHRRVPVDLSGLTPDNAAKDRLYAIRDLMRMEMPDRPLDITAPPIALPVSGNHIPRPALSKLYYTYYSGHSTSMSAGAAGKEAIAAEMLYMVVSMGSPEDMEQFTQSEIGDTDGNGWLEFLDGWGRPIFFLRWAPGYSQYSDIQVPHPNPTTDDPIGHHDPFDPRRTEEAYKLIPLIYSAGANGRPGLCIIATDTSGNLFGFASVSGNICGDPNFAKMGSPSDDNGNGTSTDLHGLITNHRIDMR